MHKHQKINNKDIYIVESHHHVLLPWSLIRRSLRPAPNLITLDHHTDTMPAFNSYRCRQEPKDHNKFKQLLTPLIESVDFNNDETINAAIRKLRHDEHIQLATLTGIIANAFAINLNSQTPSIEEKEATERRRLQFESMLAAKPHQQQYIPRPQPPYTYSIPEDNIFEISSNCAIGCTATGHDDDCSNTRANEVLESYYLDHELAQANQMAQCIGLHSIEDAPYILDIDLDYFHSERAVSPDNSETFYRLVRNSLAITIAMERVCVDDLKIEGSLINSDYVLDKVLAHIGIATT